MAGVLGSSIRGLDERLEHGTSGVFEIIRKK